MASTQVKNIKNALLESKNIDEIFNTSLEEQRKNWKNLPPAIRSTAPKTYIYSRTQREGTIGRNPSKCQRYEISGRLRKLPLMHNWLIILKSFVTFIIFADIYIDEFQEADMNTEQAKVKEYFNSLYNEYYALIYKYTLVSLNFNEYLAKDCVQEVFLTVYEKIDIVLKHPNPGGFIIITAKYIVKKHQAKISSQNEKTIPLENTQVKDLSYNVDFDEPDSDDLDLDELKVTLLQSLSSQESLLYNLFYEEKFSIAQIAERLEITPGNVKVKLFRLRAKVKNMVQGGQFFKERNSEN